MWKSSGLIIFIIVTAFTNVRLVFSATGDCTVDPGSYGACFEDESSGRMWKDKLIQLTPATNGSTQPCTNYRVNQVESEPCDVATETMNSYSSATCLGSGWSRCDNGRCIPTALRCNGDDDCGDASDEYPNNNNCTNTVSYICGIEVTTSSSSTPSKSDRYFLGIPGLENFASGFDLLTGNRRGDVLSMRPLGSCRRVLKHGEEDYYYRVPNNVNAFSQLFSVEHASGEIASTGADMLTLTHDKLELDYSFGGYLNEIDSSVGLTQSDAIKTFTLENIQTQNRYLAVTTTSKIKVFKVELKAPQNLEASNSFLERLYSLPRTDLSYDSYLSFIRDFGTHYFSSGILGGQYSMINFYDRCWIDSELEQTYEMDRADWEERLQFCDRESLRNKLNPNYVISSACTLGSGTTTSGTDILSKSVTSIAHIDGGSVSTSTPLQESITSATWQAWAETVQNNPALLMDDFELTRISKLLDYPIPTLLNTDRLQIQTLLDEAIDIYLQPYDAWSLCNCTSTCSTDNYGGAYAPYLTGTAGDEYSCRCACDNAPRIEDCNRSSTNYISYLTMLVCLLLTRSPLH